MIRAAAGWPDGVDAIPWAAQSLSGPRAKRPGRTQGISPTARSGCWLIGYSIRIEPPFGRLRCRRVPALMR